MKKIVKRFFLGITILLSILLAVSTIVIATINYIGSVTIVSVEFPIFLIIAASAIFSVGALTLRSRRTDKKEEI